MFMICSSKGKAMPMPTGEGKQTGKNHLDGIKRLTVILIVKMCTHAESKNYSNV